MAYALLPLIRLSHHMIPGTHPVLQFRSRFNPLSSAICLSILSVLLFIFSTTNTIAQETEYVFPQSNSAFRTVVHDDLCHQCAIFYPGELDCWIWGGTSYSPEGLLYGIGLDGTGILNTLYEIDYATNTCTAVMSPVNIPITMDGLVAIGGGIFYSMAWLSDSLYRWDVNANTVTVVGTTGFPNYGELCMSNGSVYYLTRTYGPNNNTGSVIRLNLADPGNSTQLGFFNSSYGIFGISATTDPNVLVAQELYFTGGVDLYRLHILDGTLTFVCDITPPSWGGSFSHITSTVEYGQFPLNPPYIDLDCDDSSGAIDADFNSLPYDCLSEGSHIIDWDPRLRSDAAIAQMTVTLANPIPDAPYEILDMTGSVGGINVIGLGTSTLTFTNTGSATLNDFLDQLEYVIYQNLSFDITAGLRTVEVQFSSITGAESNIASAYIDVVDLPHVEVDLGPDIIACDGEVILLSVNNPGEEYLWSTGEDSEEITVTAPGTYSVTVSNQFVCPSRDSVMVEYIPIIQVWLTGDSLACSDETIQLTITTDAPFPITVTITPDPGDPFVLEDISGMMSYTDLPFTNTEYYITEVLTSQPACVELPDPEQTIEMWPDYSGGTGAATLCLGDSILLGNTFYYDSGHYEVNFPTIHGCDSLVDYTITLFPTEHLYFQYTTCDPSQAGTILTFLPNANGCDTVVHSTYTLLQIDTTTQYISTCRIVDTGITTDTLINQFGCDSFLVTITLYDPPQDTTFLIQNTCDSAAVGIFTQLLISSFGCDSLVVTEVILPAPDTTILVVTSCDTAIVGVTEMLLNGIDGCDSLVITRTELVMNDTTIINLSSCDSANLGTFITSFPLPGDCDSIVITQVEFSLADSTFISEGSCFVSDTGQFMISLSNQFGCDSLVFRSVHLLPTHDLMISLSSCFPQDTGRFIQSLVNQWGCDSIVTSVVSLLPSHTTPLFSTTCDSGQAGQFITQLQNQFGCDSMIILNVEYLEPDTTVLNEFTCDSLEVGIVETLHQNSSGCDSLVILSTTLFPLPQVVILSLGNFNGYDVSCFGGNDGSLQAEVTGIPDFEYVWSTSEEEPLLHGVSAGIYTVSVTDGNGCIDSDEWNVTEPHLLEIALQVSEPECFENELGTITIEAHGGVGPYQYSQDSISFSDNPVFENLSDGLHTLFVLDKNECVASAIIGVHVPLPVSVDLGDNQILGLGDSTLITAMVNVPFAFLDSITWSGIEGSDCDTCLQQWVSPIITTVYQIEVINADGCKAEDEMTISVERNDEIFVPNIFSPNGDGINDELLISVGAFVESIQSYEIFDRWGNLVFTQNNILPSDPQLSWDGTFRNKPLNPAVYAYRLVARLRDGSSVIRYGDVTMIR